MQPLKDNKKKFILKYGKLSLRLLSRKESHGVLKYLTQQKVSSSTRNVFIMSWEHSTGHPCFLFTLQWPLKLLKQFVQLCLQAILSTTFHLLGHMLSYGQYPHSFWSMVRSMVSGPTHCMGTHAHIRQHNSRGRVLSVFSTTAAQRKAFRQGWLSS